MLKGFKDFLMRGNVVDLAVAVVVGAAFAKVVDTFVSAIITPILNSLGAPSSAGWGFSLRGGELAQKTFVNLSTIVNAIVVFVLTAAVVYFIFVLPMNRFAELRKRGIEPEPDKPSEEILLLTDIRDAVRSR
ncbi:MAG TPA: large conductance mechanosensitive channel protein MscL [Dermatophilaceae bacterium]|nr:large conductance mechanosensitive channel protein MscL [Dermatophilaceae bacterium]